MSESAATRSIATLGVSLVVVCNVGMSCASLLTFIHRSERVAIATWLALLLAFAQGAAVAQPGKDTLVVGMPLEPTPGLDPTAGAASAIAEVSLYNIFETLTRIDQQGQVSPLLAQRWSISDDRKVYTLTLQAGVRFRNGASFNSQTVKYSLLRAAAAHSLNKDQAVLANIGSIETPDDHTVVLRLQQANADLLFQLGQGTAAMVEPGSAETNGVDPVGTGPYRLKAWRKGASIVLERWAGYRAPALVRLRQVSFRFIADPSAQVAALLAGDVDAFPRVAAGRALAAFGRDKRFRVLIGSSRAKAILAMNNQRPPLTDVRVRRAISAAIDRQAVIDASADGLGVPIGSFYVPGSPGYVDTTDINAFDPARSRRLLQEAGVQLPLALSLKLPLVGYAQRGGEVIAAQLAQVGIHAKVENIEWAQWIAQVYGQHAYDLTLIAHVEPLDFGNFARPHYYWGYESAAFNALWTRINQAGNAKQRDGLMAEAQQLVANEAVAAYLYQPKVITVAKSGVQGLWTNAPIAVNDLASIHW